jgi:galactofuranosylgalactofuranosylrhamnosyl-N-acetylglucosaminyl-diphospho-decaprenol beta-1,5/1,6-galactofuranosyltransferase
MMLINLQNIILPDRKICMEDELYFRCNDNHLSGVFYDELHGALIYKRYAFSSFDTYFNSFSIGKWQYYTKLESLYLKLRFKGKFSIRIISSLLSDDEITSNLIYKSDVADNNECLIEVPITRLTNGALYFTMEALESDSEFYGGEWCACGEEEHVQDPKLALVICTFNREAYIEQTINLINDQLYGHSGSSQEGNLYVYIIDNGESLDAQKYTSANIRIVPNVNAGGVGGFARGMIEADADRDKYGLTHILLMDDDVKVHAEAIRRTLNFLKLIKPEYANAFIGGSMLRMDKPAIMHESGAVFDKRGYYPLKPSLDLTLWRNVLFNEIPESFNYFGWWYCVIPMSLGFEENLPLPLFMRFDDVEYGLRNMKHGVALNGISIWHEPFERRHSSVLEYYFMRNFMIVGAINTPNNLFAVANVLSRKIVLGLLHYNYNECHQILDAVDDYYKGLDWLIAQDPSSLHMQKKAKSEVFMNIEELNFKVDLGQYFASLRFQDGGVKRALRRLTFNGYYLPAYKDCIVTNDVTQSRKRIGSMYRAKRVMQYDITTNKGVVFERSLLKAIQVLCRFAFVVVKMLFTLGPKNDEYRKKIPYVKTKKFWQSYLNI